MAPGLVSNPGTGKDQAGNCSGGDKNNGTLSSSQALHEGTGRGENTDGKGKNGSELAALMSDIPAGLADADVAVAGQDRVDPGVVGPAGALRRNTIGSAALGESSVTRKRTLKNMIATRQKKVPTRPVTVACHPDRGPVLGGNVVEITGVPQEYFIQSSNGDLGDECDDQACVCHHKQGDADLESAYLSDDVKHSTVVFTCGVELFFGLIAVAYTATMDKKGNNVLVFKVPRGSFEGEIDVKLVLDGAVVALGKYEYEGALLNAPDRTDHVLKFPQRYISVLRRLRGTHAVRRYPRLLQQCLAEAVGTGMIVLTGVGIVNAAVFTGAQMGIWQVAVIWGFGVSLAIYCTASISGAHLNPAVSFALALLRPEEFPLRKLVPYWIAQFLGAIAAGAINLLAYSGPIAAFEAKNNIVRGEPNSILSAQAFGEYFPNPGLMYSSAPAFAGDPAAINPALNWTLGTVSVWGSLGIEIWGTCVLMFVIFALTDKRNTALLQKEMAPFFIGFTVATLISLYAPMNQAGYNPARDWGPRIVSAMAGWGRIAFPGPQNGAWTYLVGPLIGAPLGGAFYDFIFMHGL